MRVSIKKKTKIEIIAGNEDNLMFSQANGKREKFIVFFDSTRVFFFVYKQPGVFTWVNVCTFMYI